MYASQRGEPGGFGGFGGERMKVCIFRIIYEERWEHSEGIDNEA